MSCNCNLVCPHFHKTTSMTVDSSILVVTATNTSATPADETKFCLAVCQNANNVSSTAIPVNIVINGSEFPMYNKFGKAMQSTELANYTRKLMRGYFVINGSSSYVIFNELPRCRCS